MAPDNTYTTNSRKDYQGKRIDETPWIFGEAEFGVRLEAVIGLVAQGGSVHHDVVHRRRDVEVILFVVAEQVLVDVLPLIHRHVAEVDGLGPMLKLHKLFSPKYV
jgi:hypothetical protein